MTTMTTPREPPAPGLDARTRTALFAVALFGAMFAIGAGATSGARAAMSVGAGVALALLNLYGLARILGALLGSRVTPSPNAGIWGVLAVGKIVALFGGVWLLLTNGLVDPMPLVLGWGALPVGIAIGSFVSDKTDPPAPAHDKEPPPGSAA